MRPAWVWALGGALLLWPISPLVFDSAGGMPTRYYIPFHEYLQSKLCPNQWTFYTPYSVTARGPQCPAIPFLTGEILTCAVSWIEGAPAGALLYAAIRLIRARPRQAPRIE